MLADELSHTDRVELMRSDAESALRDALALRNHAFKYLLLHACDVVHALDLDVRDLDRARFERKKVIGVV